MGRFRGVVPGKLEEGGFMRILPPDLPGNNEPFFFRFRVLLRACAKREQQLPFLNR